MNTKDFKKIARILKEAYAELEKEATASDTSIFSEEYKQIQDILREQILSRMGFTLEEYRQAKDKYINIKQTNLDESSKQQVSELLDTQIPTKEEIQSIAEEVAKAEIKPPQIINKIVKKTTKIVEKPIKETVIQREVYDPSEIMAEIGYINDRLDKIIIPEIPNIDETLEQLKSDFDKRLKDNINTLGMPDFRKLAMGLQSQIDALGQSSGGGTPAGSDTQVQFNDGGSFGADAHFYYNKTTDVLHVHGLAGDATDGLLIESEGGTDIAIMGAANTANVTWYGNHNFNTVTASRVAQFSASKTLESSTVTTTELGYLSGVTSAIQTQINGKANTALSNLASVAINTSLLSDTTKTDDLGSATYKWKDTWTQNVYADSIGYNSLRAVFGERQIFINELTDALWRANRRYTVTQTGSGTIASLFDAGFETTYVVPVSTTDVININVANQSGVPAAGVTYPEGKLYVHFYYVNNLYSSIQIRTKHNGVWFTASAPTDISIATGDKVLEFSVPSNNYMTDIELTVTTDGTNPVWITGINYIPLRWTSELESPFFDKVLSDNTLIGNTITFKNTANSTTASINANDNWYMGVGGSGGKFGIGTSSLTYSLHVNGHSLTESTNYHYFYDSTYGIRASTGLEFKSANLHRWLIGSTEKMRMDSNGDFGIGTSNPLNKLHAVADSATASSSIARLSGGSSGFSGANDAGTAYSLIFDGCAYQTSIVQVTGAKIEMAKENTWNYADTPTGTKGALVFYTSAGTPDSPTLTEKMRIASSGNVGIGTSSPLGGLHITRNYSSTLNQTLRLTANIPGIAFEDSNGAGNHRNFALMNNYASNGLFEINYSTTAGGLATSLALSIDALNNGNVIIKSLDTDATAPTTSGTTKMVITDANGQLSFTNIPTGGGDALTTNPLSQFASTTSLQLKGVISDETGSGALVFADTPTMVTPVLSGTPNASGELGRDTTQLAPNYYDNGRVGIIPKVVASGSGTQSITDSTASDQDFTAIDTIPANTLFTGKKLRVTLMFEMTTGVSTNTFALYLKLGSTKVFTQTAQNFINSSTINFTMQFIISGRASASASSAVTTSAVIGMGANLNGGNITNQPVNLATNGSLDIVPGGTFSGTGSTETLQLLDWLVEELN